MKTYAYCRISTNKQSIERQIRNILAVYPDAIIYQEAFTGTKIQGRTEFNRLQKIVKSGDTIVFDSVSRMSRDADEGIEQYFRWYESGVDLVFLKESYINTETYKNAIKNQVALTGEKVDLILQGVNAYLMELAREQIKIAFGQAEKEVEDLHQRTKEGIETARLNGKQIGQKKGTTFNIKKKEPTKAQIFKKSKDFHGTMSDVDLIKVLGIARNTYYKYKKELTEEIQGRTE